MATYLLVNLAFIIAVVLVFRVKPTVVSRLTLLVLVVLLILTAVFDSLIVGFGIVGYDAQKILGIYVGNAPIEDFFYAVLAVILVPAIWGLEGKKND